MSMLYYIVERTVNSQALFGDRHERIRSSEHPVLSENPTTEFAVMNNMYLLLSLVIPADIHYVRVDCILHPSANRLQQASLSTQKHWRQRSSEGEFKA